MAMSKKKFVFLLLSLIVLLGGGIAIVIIFKNKNGGADSEANGGPSDEKARQQTLAVRRGVIGSPQECQAWLRNPTKSWQYAGRFTNSRIATRESISARTRDKIIRNSYWLTGDSESDTKALNGIRYQACMGKIPVVVIRMRPNEGLKLSHEHSNWDFYKPKSIVSSWTEYDENLKRYLRDLNGAPAMIILEPDLLMFTFDVRNNQHRWSNKKYEEEFLKRANRLITRLPYARVYVDAGNAAYLSLGSSTLDQMAKTLLRLPGLRGFSINANHFVNQTYNEFMARQLYCRTGFHYVVDTSRNGGEFSKQLLPKTKKCLFDPPHVKKGQFPGWAWGSRREIRAPRLKRWINQLGSSADEFASRSNFQQKPSTTRSTTRETTNPVDRNDPNWAVKQFNNLVNSRRNSGNQHPHQTSNNNQNTQGYNLNYIRNSRPNERKPSGPARRPYSTPSANLNDNSKGISNEPSGVRSLEVADQYFQSFKSSMRTCMSRKSNVIAHDANIWIKTPGEADGRLYRYGVFRKCLIDHDISCDDSCRLYVQADIDRESSCQCSTDSDTSVGSFHSQNPFK